MIKVDDYIFRGPRPDSPAEYDALKASGIKTILNLELGFFDFINGTRAYQDKSCATRGITSIHIPMGIVLPPNNLKTLNAFMALTTSEKMKNAIYVHCKSGVDRTGFVCAVYRMRIQAWSFDKAYVEWVSLGRHWFYDFWKTKLKIWEKKK